MIYVTKFQETTGRIRASINRGSATWTPLWDVADANYVERIKSKLIWSNLKSSKNSLPRLVTWPCWRGLKWTEVLTWVNKCTLLLNDYETRRHGRIRPLRPINAWISNFFFALFFLSTSHMYITKLFPARTLQKLRRYPRHKKGFDRRKRDLRFLSKYNQNTVRWFQASFPRVLGVLMTWWCFTIF